MVPQSKEEREQAEGERDGKKILAKRRRGEKITEQESLGTSGDSEGKGNLHIVRLHPLH